MVYAHSRNPAGRRHDLVEHLTAVAEQARAFAAKFGAGDTAYWAGLWHDLGKFTSAFQDYLMAQEAGQPHPRVPHAIWGAALAYRLLWTQYRSQETWKEIALPIAGHHAGLADGGTVAQTLEAFLMEKREDLATLARHLHSLPAPPKLRQPALAPARRELRLRMIASALVDADYLDTERHFNADQAATRGAWPPLTDLCDRFERVQREWMAGKDQTQRINQIRTAVYEDCVRAAAGPRGVYRLTVPTGGGKTRSGLAFALHHAKAHALDRVVVAIPYTSIIDQTARVYRDILEQDGVLEHHSQVVPPDRESQDPRSTLLRLSAENWDAPLVVTTTVQLFESLLGRRPGRLRKLHNLARSVILLDEVQTLPTALLEPTLDVVRALVEDYGVTVVLSTATQPALEDSHYLTPFQGLHVAEIVRDYARHFRDLRRVDYELRSAPLDWDTLATEVGAHAQVMVVLNSRRDALALVEALQAQGASDVFHLSTLLCGAHRRRTLHEITTRLDAGQPVRLVSTQVVEAGVDLDFPTVWRAMGPLDRIVQAAGRCNREGRRARGRVVIFEPAGGGAPRGPYAAAIAEARLLLDHHGADRLHDPDLYREFFARLFAVVSVDKQEIQALRRELKYPEVAERYKLIEEATVPVVVDYCDGLRRLADWRRSPSRATWQRLQPYLVNIYTWEAERHGGGLLTPVPDGGELHRWLGEYDDRVGLAGVLADPSDLV